MARKIGYWLSTGIIAAMMTMSAVIYLSGSPQAVTGFEHLGYPQHLRIMLGIAKAAGVIVLLLPGLALVKEWAYAGFAFAWIIAFVAHSRAGDGASSYFPLVLLALLIVSYVTRPSNRRIAVLSTA